MRNVECGMRNGNATSPTPHSEFRIPHLGFTMAYETLLFEPRDGIAFITINRPEKLNALNDTVINELAHAAERLATDRAIRGAIITGAGTKAFVAGADIAELAQQGPLDGKARALRGQS